MEQPKKDAPKTEEEPKTSLNWLKIDHTLRPEGSHFDAEMGLTTTIVANETKK